MKATVNTADLKAYLKAAKPFVTNKAIPILETVQVIASDGFVKLTVTDLDNYLINTIPATDVTGGAICIPFGDFAKFVLTCQDDHVSIESYDDYVVNVNGLKLQGQGPEINEQDEPTNLFPLIPELDKPDWLTFSGLLFHEIETGIRFSGTDDLRPVMTGFFIGTYDKVLTVACTDAHSLYKGEVGQLDKDFGIIVNGTAARNLPKIAGLIGNKDGNVNVDWDEYNVVFSQDSWRLVGRLIDGKYPAINAVIPKDNPIQVTFNKAAMLKAIDKVKIAANKGKIMNVNINDGQIELECIDLDLNKELRTSIPCHIEGDGIEIAFNYAFLSELLKAVVSPEVTLQMSAANRAGLIQEFHRTFLIMPVMRTKAEEVEA